jgi:uncharacterized caspase-like protein
MSLTRPNQELRRDLKAAARDLEEAARELFAGVGQRNSSEVMPVLDRIEALHIQADRLKGYADEVSGGRVVRATLSRFD